MSNESALLGGIVLLLVVVAGWIVFKGGRKKKPVSKKQQPKPRVVQSNSLEETARRELGQIRRDLSLISPTAKKDPVKVRECLAKRKLLKPELLRELVKVAETKDNELAQTLKQVTI